MGYTITTKKGYELLEVASAFQKSVRRGLEDDALYWAIELHTSNFDEYLWKRMIVIVSEDIGMANPYLPATIYALRQFYIEQKKKADEKHHPEKQALIHAVMLLVRSPKSRLNDWIVIEKYRTHETEFKQIPDWALDKHTARGRTMGRGFDYFFDNSTTLAGHQEQPGEDEARQRAREILKKQPEQSGLFEPAVNLHGE